MDKGFSTVINTYLKLNNKTQKQLADELNVSKSTVSGYCLGTRFPDLNMLKKIQKNLNIPLENIFSNEIDESLSNLDKDELFLLTVYRNLNYTDKESFMKLVKDVVDLLKR